MKPLRIISIASCWLAASCLMFLSAGGLRAADDTNLITRTFKVSTNALWEVFDCDDGAKVRRAAPSNATPSKLLNDAAHFIFTSCGGLDFSPPKSIFYDETNGRLIVHSTVRDLEDVEQVVEAMKIKPPQMVIRVRFFETSEGASTVGWLAAMSATNWSGRHTRIFTEAQSRVVLPLLEQRAGVKMVGTFDATTVSGRRIHVPSSPASEPQILDNNIPATGTNDARPTQLGSTDSSVEVFPTGGIYNRTIQMSLTADIPGAIIERDPCILTPCTCSASYRESHQFARDLSAATIVESGQTFFYSVKFQKRSAQATSSQETNSMLIFVAPTIIGAAIESPKDSK